MKEYSPEEANAEALRRIKEWAARSDVEEWLNLDGLNLTRVPPEVWKLTSLKRMDLGCNRLTTLPPEIGQLTGLTELLLYSNQLTTLPAGIGQLSSLTLLHLHSNRLTALPPECGQLASLEFLNCGDNLLTSLPAEIGHLSALESASFDKNRLTTIPPEICELENLRALYLHGNSLLGIPLEILGATSEDYAKGKKGASARSILNYYFRAHPEVCLSRKAKRNLAKTEEPQEPSPVELEEIEEVEKSPETKKVPKPLKLIHEVVLSQRLATGAMGVILFGAMLTALGVLFLFAPRDNWMISYVVFFPMGVPALLLGIFGKRSAMERETVSIEGSPPEVWVRRFRAPKRVEFDSPRVKVLRDRRYRASEIEWVSVDVGTQPDDGASPGEGSRVFYYWHPVIKPKDQPPKIVGTFCGWSSVKSERFREAAEEAGALGREVARALKVPFRWDECPAFKAEPSWKYSLYRTFTKQGWDWPWSVPAKAPAKPIWKLFFG